MSDQIQGYCSFALSSAVVHVFDDGVIEGVCGALHTRIKQGAAGTACQRQKRGPRPYVVWTDASGTVQVLELVWHSATDQMLPSEANHVWQGPTGGLYTNDNLLQG
ncbi:unnamed protein product [Penicillium camemberti]|uniref:Str. FM013 n=1 Tax=Penicillium camemberti (strain FM 013) TaxID=1429867 RepID=A0A0G4NTF4_PENC3|nr:unnamed protein product [Penicillium camemberti]